MRQDCVNLHKAHKMTKKHGYGHKLWIRDNVNMPTHQLSKAWQPRRIE